MRLEPMYDRLLIKREDATSTSKGGIVIPRGAQEKNNLAVVVAIGPGHRNPETGELTPLKVKIGMTVMIGKWAGDEVKVGGVDHLMVREADVMAIVHEEGEVEDD